VGIAGLGQGIATIGIGTDQAIADARSAIEQGALDAAGAGYNARQVTIRGAREAGRLRMLGAQNNETQKVGYAASNVDPTSGTAAAVQADSAAMTELDAQTVKNNAAREAWGFRLQGVQGGKNLQTKLGSVQRAQYGSIATGLGQFTSGAAGMGD
jgi:hypothetical protein